MSAIINGSSPSVTFSDGTTQSTSAIVSGYVPYANLPAGSVLQVVQSNYSSGYVSTTSSSFATTGISVSITPKFSTSKILAFFTTSADVGGNRMFVTLYRGGSNLGGSNGFVEISSTTWVGASFNYLDSPSTTSSTTYTVYFRNADNSNTVYLGGDSPCVSTFTLMEIAA